MGQPQRWPCWHGHQQMGKVSAGAKATALTLELAVGHLGAPCSRLREQQSKEGGPSAASAFWPPCLGVGYWLLLLPRCILLLPSKLMFPVISSINRTTALFALTCGRLLRQGKRVQAVPWRSQIELAGNICHHIQP